MKSESLRSLKTPRDVKNSLKIGRLHRKQIMTHNQLHKPLQEEVLPDPMELSRALRQEKAQFKKQDLAVEKAKRKVLQERKKLAQVVAKNQEIMNLRQKLQDERWDRSEHGNSKSATVRQDASPVAPDKPTTEKDVPHSNFKKLRVEY